MYTDHTLLGKGRGRAIILSLLEELKKDPRRYTAVADIIADVRARGDAARRVGSGPGPQT